MARFGGYKQSGIGREMGLAGLEEYLQIKAIATARGVRRRRDRCSREVVVKDFEGMRRFDEKVGIVTGAGGGIGQAYAEALAREGAAVVVADINQAGAERVAAGIRSEGGTALAVPVDISDPASAKAMADRTWPSSAESTTWSTMPPSSAA